VGTVVVKPAPPWASFFTYLYRPRARYLERGTLIHLICMATRYLTVSPIILKESTTSPPEHGCYVSRATGIAAVAVKADLARWQPWGFCAAWAVQLGAAGWALSLASPQPLLSQPD
jgi:hypothetical protein